MRNYIVGQRVAYKHPQNIHSMGLFKPGDGYPGTVIAAFGGFEGTQPPSYRVRLDKKWDEYLIDGTNPESPCRYPHLAGEHIIVGNVSEAQLSVLTEEKAVSVTA